MLRKALITTDHRQWLTLLTLLTLVTCDWERPTVAFNILNITNYAQMMKAGD